MYGTSKTNGVSSDVALNNVDIPVISGADGVYLRNALIDRFYQTGYPEHADYRLRIGNIAQSFADFDVTIESEATRRQITLQTNISLEEITTGNLVLTRDVKVVSSYDVLGSQFTTRVAEEDSWKSALNDLARQIELQVVLYLKN